MWKTNTTPKTEEVKKTAAENAAVDTPETKETTEDTQTPATTQESAENDVKNEAPKTEDKNEPKTTAKGKFKVKDEAGAISVDGKVYHPGDKIDITEAKAKEFWIFDLLD